MAASVKSLTFTRSTFRCVVIISISNDIIGFTEHFRGSVPYFWQKRFDFSDNVGGGSAKLY